MFKEIAQTIQSAKRLSKTSFAINKLIFLYLSNKGEGFAEALRDTMYDLGSTYIKLGQLIASSPTIFPQEYVDAFQDCLDQTPALAFTDIEPLLEKALGPKLKKHFSYIDPVPLGSASIAQVHAATLMTGEQVVIKIEKPGVKEILTTDFQFLQFATQLLELISPKAWKSSVKDIVLEIRNGMLEECDFHKEADNIEEFARFLQQADIETVKVPKVYRALSSETVLVMERFYGVPISDIDGVRDITPDPAFALSQALNTWFSSLKHCQIYHADLHAGNVMMLNDGSIGFIDFGIVGRLSPRTWEGLTSLTTCLPAEDFDGLAVALSKIGATRQEIDLTQFAQDLKVFWQKISADQWLTEGGADDFWRIISSEFSNIATRHGIRFPREFTLLIKQFLYFDRYIRLLAPEIDLFAMQRMEFADEYMADNE